MKTDETLYSVLFQLMTLAHQCIIQSPSKGTCCSNVWSRKDLNGKDKTQTTTTNPKGIVLKIHFPLKQINSKRGGRSCRGLDFQEAGGESQPLLHWSRGGRQLLSLLFLLLPELSSLFQPPWAHLPPPSPLEKILKPLKCQW